MKAISEPGKKKNSAFLTGLHADPRIAARLLQRWLPASEVTGDRPPAPLTAEAGSPLCLPAGREITMPVFPHKREFKKAFTCNNKSQRINKKKVHVVFRITRN